MTPATPSPARPVGAVLLAAVLFGTAGTAQALGPDATTPLGVGAARIVIGTAVLWLAVALAPRGPSWREVVATVRTHRGLIVLGGVGVAVYTPAFLTAVDRTGVAVGTVVAVGMGPFFAGALEWAWRGVAPARGWVVGTTVTVIGATALVAAAQPPDAGGVDVLGLLLALGAGAGYALYSVTAKRTMSAGVTPTLALAAPFTVGAVVVALLAAGEPFGWATTADGAVMALHLGVLATGAAYLLFGYGLHRLTSATTVTLVLAEPLTAALLGAVVLDEVLGVGGWAGVAVVLAGLTIVGRTAEVAIEPVPGDGPDRAQPSG
jgi:DME family drug/metabolite transporter